MQKKSKKSYRTLKTLLGSAILIFAVWITAKFSNLPTIYGGYGTAAAFGSLAFALAVISEVIKEKKRQRKRKESMNKAVLEVDETESDDDIVKSDNIKTDRLNKNCSEESKN